MTSISIKELYTSTCEEGVIKSLLENKQFYSLRQSVIAGGHITNLTLQKDYRRLSEEKTLESIYQFRKDHGLSWKDLLLLILERTNTALYFNCFTRLVQSEFGGSVKSWKELQEFTGIYEMNPTDSSFGCMLSLGEIWDNSIHAEQQLGYVWECGIAYGYINFLEDLFREGVIYKVISMYKPSLESYPLDDNKFPFCSQWYNHSKAISHAFCLAFDLFMEDTKAEWEFLQFKTEVPDEIVLQAMDFRKEMLAGLK